MTDRDAQATPRVIATDRDALFARIRFLEAALTAATARAEEAERQANKQAIDWRTYDANTKRADAAESRLAALEAALRKPTAEMLRAANKADLDYSNNRFCGDGGLSRMEFIYKAMTAVAISALPDAGKESGGT